MKPKPILLTPPLRRTIRSKLLRGVTPGEVAAATGISRRLLWMWIANVPTIARAFEEGRRCPVCRAVVGVRHGAPVRRRRGRPAPVRPPLVAEPTLPSRCA